MNGHQSLQGHWREEHIFELTQALELYKDKITECDREIEGWNGLRTAATANLRLPMVKAPSGERAALRCPDPPVSDDGGGPDPD